MGDQTVPIPDNGAKIWLGENHAQNVLFWNQELKCACFGFLDTSVIAWRIKRVEFIGMGGDRSFHGMFTYVC